VQDPQAYSARRVTRRRRRSPPPPLPHLADLTPRARTRHRPRS
jgi:DNA segregation ATPase FtsK/SpoIIIE-like protein